MTHKIIVELNEASEKKLREVAERDYYNASLSSVATNMVESILCHLTITDLSQRPQDGWRPTIYISGPISDDPDYKEKFHAAHQMLEECGFEVLDPTELVKVSDEKDYSDYLSEAVWHMLQCDQLYMLKGWSQSTGAKLELKLAKRLGKKIKYE